MITPSEVYEPLHLRVTDVPKLSSALMFGFQQAMLCLSGLLVYPFLVSEAVCAGDATVGLRVQLIAATFVSCGIATVIQTTFGLRLSILHGPAMAFLPPLLAYKSLRSSECLFTENDYVSEAIWHGRLQEISGSLFVACITFILIGGTGLAGVVARLIGPITIVPLMTLLTISIVPTIEIKLSLHWISLVTLLCIIMMAVYFENFRIPIPYYSIKKKQVLTTRVRLFGQFPYLISILLVWFICYIMTITNLEPYGGQARTDKNISMIVLRESPWFQIPYPGYVNISITFLGLHTFFEKHKNNSYFLTLLIEFFAAIINHVAEYVNGVILGATLRQRGLHSHNDDRGKTDENAYALPEWINRIQRAMPILGRLPFLPSDPPTKPLEFTPDQNI
uniref:Sulfate_transp domain-containing protein n=1 Tax=Heterorhabditis bacteriophora TaxID=37862 RepID=A0A1I7XRC4_HETBA